MVSLAINTEDVFALEAEKILVFVLTVADLTKSALAFFDGIRHPINIVLIEVIKQLLAIWIIITRGSFLYVTVELIIRVDHNRFGAFIFFLLI